eukprot:1156160-Pelagomonas_calceolata.AAC.7
MIQARMRSFVWVSKMCPSLKGVSMSQADPCVPCACLCEQPRTVPSNMSCNAGVLMTLTDPRIDPRSLLNRQALHRFSTGASGVCLLAARFSTGDSGVYVGCQDLFLSEVSGRFEVRCRRVVCDAHREGWCLSCMLEAQIRLSMACVDICDNSVRMSAKGGRPGTPDAGRMCEPRRVVVTFAQNSSSLGARSKRSKSSSEP